MATIMGNEIVKTKDVNTTGKRSAICMYRKIAGKGCNGCPFLHVDTLCARPPRNNPSAVLIEGAH